jgi:hypothetical protein
LSNLSLLKQNVELVAVCAGNAVALINPMIGASDQWEATDVILSRAAADNTDDGAAVSWGQASTAQHAQGYRIVLGHAAGMCNFAYCSYPRTIWISVGGMLGAKDVFEESFNSW